MTYHRKDFNCQRTWYPARGTKTSSRMTDFRFLVVVDLEANCVENGRIEPLQETIEFSAVLFDMRKTQGVDQFQEYVRPEVVRRITPFCTKLTGITQDDVAEALSFKEVIEEFDNWLQKHGLVDSFCAPTHIPWAIATIGEWDLRTLLKNQANYHNIRLPYYYEHWVNLKLIFRDQLLYYPYSMATMMKDLGIIKIGKFHSGIDDATNTCQIVRKLVKKGADFQITSNLQGRFPSYQGATADQWQNSEGKLFPGQPPKMYSPERSPNPIYLKAAMKNDIYAYNTSLYIPNAAQHLG
uniref:Exonuclease domain-containing protein n=1 Tax=Steinernema glaseri TaxID=37863 RepID=A0A1I7Y7W2_9BILA